VGRKEEATSLGELPQRTELKVVSRKASRVLYLDSHTNKRKVLPALTMRSFPPQVNAFSTIALKD